MDLSKKGYQMKILSSLEKVFPDQEPVYRPECALFTSLKGELFSFQIGYAIPSPYKERIKFQVESPIKDQIRLRTVQLMPSRYPCHTTQDDNYLRTTPGLYPDLLRDLPVDGIADVPADQWSALWIDVNVLEDMDPGVYPITIQMGNEQGETLCSAQTTLTVYDAVLPEQELIHTEWFHGDCLADYYGVEVFSEKHWEILENFIALGVSRGVNMFLTPIFTPPLDTAVGTERTTIQLVDVTVENGQYRFDFQKLKRWVEMCQRVGVQYFEISHLFTQWGAKAAPKIMATADGEYKRIFGWDTPSVGGAYTVFLQAFLPQLTAKLKEWGIAGNTYFHISDEPSLEHLDYYLSAKKSVEDCLKGFHVIDALSNYDFYEKGVVAHPIPANNHIQPFLDHKVPDLWTYYCTSQYLEVSNRFFCMPSARSRAYGTQLYKYDIKGILHWGYNFYNSQYSLHHIDPYQVTDAGGAFPSGDSYLVYPGPDGVPEDSIRSMVMYELAADVRAMKLLESLSDKETVMELIEGDLGEPITFFQYPKSDTYYITLRNRINREISNRVQK